MGLNRVNKVRRKENPTIACLVLVDEMDIMVSEFCVLAVSKINIFRQINNDKAIILFITWQLIRTGFPAI